VEQARLGELPMLSLKHVPLEMLSTGISKLGRPTNIETSNLSRRNTLARDNCRERWKSIHVAADTWNVCQLLLRLCVLCVVQARGAVTWPGHMTHVTN